MEYRVQVGERPSPPPGFPWRPVAAAAAAAGDLLARTFSHESEHDLAMMVSDFLENGSSGGEPHWYSSDSESGFSDLHHLAERISFWKRIAEQSECDLLSVVQALLPSIKENDLLVVNDGQCNGSCIRHSLAKLLRFSGYDAAVCLSKWQGVGKIPGGDHEYIDVVIRGINGVSERMIIDVDFKSHFEIARAVESYEAVLLSLPVVYVGSLERLKQFLQVMVEATKFSLKQNSMPLPPWRSLSYLQAKWDSPCERKTNSVELNYYLSSDSINHNQCVKHLRSLKASLRSDIDPECYFKYQIASDKKRLMKFERLQRALSAPPLTGLLNRVGQAGIIS